MEIILVVKIEQLEIVVTSPPKIIVKVPLPVSFVILLMGIVPEILVNGLAGLKQEVITVQGGFVLIMEILARGIMATDVVADP